MGGRARRSPQSRASRIPGDRNFMVVTVVESKGLVEGCRSNLFFDILSRRGVFVQRSPAREGRTSTRDKPDQVVNDGARFGRFHELARPRFAACPFPARHWLPKNRVHFDDSGTRKRLTWGIPITEDCRVQSATIQGNPISTSGRPVQQLVAPISSRR